MTFTIVGHCPRTHQIGVGIATYSLIVGALCPCVKANVGAVVPQANVNPELGPLGLHLMEMGFPVEGALRELEGADPLIEYRQVGIVDAEGSAVARTGSETRAWAGHLVGKGYVAMGNALAGEEVVQAIARAFEASEGEELDERLLRAVEAGRDAGGQRGAEAQHLPERSAALLVYERRSAPLSPGWMDLRVDAHETAVEELRRLHDLCKPYIPYHQQRIKEPFNALPQDVWVRQQMAKT